MWNPYTLHPFNIVPPLQKEKEKLKEKFKKMKKRRGRGSRKKKEKNTLISFFSSNVEKSTNCLRDISECAKIQKMNKLRFFAQLKAECMIYN